LGETVLAIGTIPPGPIHVVTSDALLLRSLEAGTNVSIDLSRSSPWLPSIPSAHELVTLQAACEAVDIDSLIDSDLHGVWDEVKHTCNGENVVQLLQGRGSGLTPSGDDVVAGLMLADAWKQPSNSARDARVKIAEQMRTTNLSKSFLHWAARGQSIAPVHDLIGAALSPDGPRFFESVESLCAIGGSSGRALLAGLLLGLRAEVHFAPIAG